MNVVVVGGGLSGLVAAHDLACAGVPTVVLERAPRWGGQIWTASVNGFVMELGAEGYAAGRRAVRDLCEELGLTDRLVSQQGTTAFELHDGQLVPLPPGRAAELVGIQATREDVGRGMTTLIGGMGELIEALRTAASGQADLRLGTAAQGLKPGSHGWGVSTSGGESLQADAVVLAVSAAAASTLLRPIFPDAAERLAAFRTVSSVAVSLAFERREVNHPLEGAGFVSSAGPHADGFRACAFASSQFPGRAPSGHVLLRVFFRPGPSCPLDASDDRWVELALAALRPVLGIRADPGAAWVARWPAALPRYAEDHVAQLSAITQQVQRRAAPLVLAGAAYRRAGIAGAVESARAGVRGLLLAATP